MFLCWPIKLRRTDYNWALLLTVAVPPVCTCYLLSHFCAAAEIHSSLCDIYMHMPLLSVNILWLIHVDITFYIVSLVQDSTWLIDPYWTLAPPMLALFWISHPAAALWKPRREHWRAGAREDWRYADMKQRCGRWWPLIQVLTVYCVQHCMLVGLTLPWMPIAFSGSPWNAIDTCACCLCILGLCIATHADNTLYHFSCAPHGRGLRVLQEGLWAVSRHPNHLGEQMWWWGVAMFATAAGSPWTIVGTLFNSVCMCQIMVMVEKRMCERPERAKQYKQYQQQVSFCVPWCIGRAALDSVFQQRFTTADEGP